MRAGGSWKSKSDARIRGRLWLVRQCYNTAMVRRYALLAALPLLVAAQAAPPAPWAETRGDLDGDGKPERARLDRDGVLVVETATGRELLKVPLPDAGRIERAQLKVVAVEERP